MTQDKEPHNPSETPWRMASLLLVKPRTVAQLVELTGSMDATVRKHLVAAEAEGLVAQIPASRSEGQRGRTSAMWSWVGVAR